MYEYEKEHRYDMPVVAESPKPTAFLPIPKSMPLDGMKVGEEVTVTLKGKVKGLSDRGYGKDLDLELYACDCKGMGNEFEEMAEDD